MTTDPNGPLMRRDEIRKPWGLILALVIAAAAGVIGLPLQYATFRSIGAVSQEDIERNRALVEQVKILEQMSSRDIDEHRVANDEAHAEICRMLYENAVALGNDVKPCDFRRLVEPQPSPSPS